MKRRSFFRAGSSAALAGAALLQPLAAQNAATLAKEEVLSTPPTGKVFASAPVLMNATAGRITVLITLQTPATGWLEYGETESLGQRLDINDQGFLPYEDKALIFQLEGLKPGQSYFYRIHATPITFQTAYKIQRGAEAITEISSFRTLNPAAEHASITVWNDTHQNKETLARLIERHQKEPTDALIWNGDITNDITTESLLLEEYFHPAGKAFATSAPLYFSRGNHDVRGAAARKLSHYAPGLDGKYCYTFRQGPLACLVLDTGEDKPDDMEVYAGLNDYASHRRNQREWLAKAIEDPEFQAAPFRIAFMHIPLFWDAPVLESWHKVWNGFNGWICEDAQKQWHDLLVKAGIRLVISGHTHHASWFPPNEAHPYGQLIGGGPKPDQATTIRVLADAKELRFTVTKLDGTQLFDQVISA